MTLPEGVKADWDLRKLTPQQIESDTKSLIDSLQKMVDGVAAVPLEQATYDTILKVRIQ